MGDINPVGKDLHGADPEVAFLHKYGLSGKPVAKLPNLFSNISINGSSEPPLPPPGLPAQGCAARMALPAPEHGASSSSSSGSAGSVRSAGPAPNGSAARINYAKHGQQRGRDLPPVPNDSHSSNNTTSGQPPEIPSPQPGGSGTGTARHKVNKVGGQASSIPEVEITIPNDGSLASFSADAMANLFRSMRLDDRLVSHLHRNGLDGRKFGRLKDSDLENLHLNNPIIVYFRDRTAPAVAKKNKQRIPFVL